MEIIQIIFLISTIFVSLLFYYGALEAAYSIQLKGNKQSNLNTPVEALNNNLIQNTNDLYLLNNISETQIKLLNDEQIFRIDQLRDIIKTRETALIYSKKLKIYTNLVDEWVRLGEFSKLYGITQDYIEILERAGIKRIEDLQYQKPELLYRKLKENNTVDSLPTLGMLKYWQRTALEIETSIARARIGKNTIL